MSAKLFTREDAVVLFHEMLDQAIAGGKTCSTMAARIENAKFLATRETEAVALELAERAREAPIPPWVVVRISPTSAHAMVKTPLVHEDESSGYPRVVGGGFTIAKTGHASQIELPKSEVDAWIAGGDPVFAKLVAAGDLVIEPLAEPQARELELLIRRRLLAGQAMARTDVSTSSFVGAKLGVFKS